MGHDTIRMQNRSCGTAGDTSANIPPTAYGLAKQEEDWTWDHVDRHKSHSLGKTLVQASSLAAAKPNVAYGATDTKTWSRSQPHQFLQEHNTSGIMVGH